MPVALSEWMIGNIRREVRLCFFDPIYRAGDVVGYLCSAERWLPEADALVG